MTTNPEKQAKIDAAFEQWVPFMGLADYGYAVPLANRLRQALQDVGEFRRTHSFRGASGETEALSVRVVCDTLASQVLAAAPAELDAATIRWVVAGLRCPAQPFCTGCTRCVTVTSPSRAAEVPRRLM